MKRRVAYQFKACLFFLFISNSQFAQPFTTRIYTANNGLPDSYVQGVYQDQQGYLWVGTYTGLSRFDGQHFVTTEISGKSVLPSSNVVLQDKAGRLWVTYKKTVAILQRDTVITFPTSDGQPMGYVFGGVQLRNNQIWVLLGRGAYEFTGNQWKRIEFPAEFRDLNCRQVIETDEGLYINFGKVIVLKTKNGDYKKICPYQSDNSFYITMHMLGNRIYAITSDHLFRIESNNITEIFKGQLSTTLNYTFFIDSKGRFWVSTEKYGLLVSKPGAEDVLDYRITLPFNLTTYIIEDRDNNIWASNYEGLIKIKEVAFTSFNKENGKMYDNIRYLGRNNAGDVIIAPNGSGLYDIESTQLHPRQFDFSQIKNFANDVVDGISFDDEGSLWIITRSKKLLKQDGKRAIDFSRFLANTTQGFFAISFDTLSKELIVASDKLYIGNENGFSTWAERFKTNELVQPRFICSRRDGTFLITTRDSGIYLVNRAREPINVSKQLEVYSNFREVRAYEDPAGGIWIMKSAEGLSRFVEKKEGQFEKVITITTRDGLPNNTIFSAVFDKQNKLWLATLSGLATVTRTGSDSGSKYIINRIGEELGTTVLNWGAANITCDRQNNIWVSTLHELIKIEPGRIYPKKHPPGISIEKISLNSKEPEWKKYTDSLAGYFHLPFNPVLGYKENSLSISYEGISFSVSPGLQYSYKLSSDSSTLRSDNHEWSEPAGNDNISFIKLPPGHYTFAVKARETGTDWSDPAYFSFVIRPPFWTRWWFRALLIASGVAIIWWMLRFRIRRIQRKSEWQNQMHELEMKALKAQMNPHFIYNALNSIQSLVMDGKQQESVKYISKFARLLRQVLEHSGRNLVTLDKELNTIELYVQLEMLRMNMQLNFTVAIDDQILPEKEWVPPLILQPFIENALWHGLNRKEGEKKLSLLINSDDNWIYATITDNGIGRQKAAELKAGNRDYPRSMGMEITGKRIQLVNRDEKATFTINDLADARGNAAGTEVIVKIRRQTNINPA